MCVGLLGLTISVPLLALPVLYEGMEAEADRFKSAYGGMSQIAFMMEVSESTKESDASNVRYGSVIERYDVIMAKDRRLRAERFDERGEWNWTMVINGLEFVMEWTPQARTEVRPFYPPRPPASKEVKHDAWLSKCRPGGTCAAGAVIRPWLDGEKSTVSFVEGVIRNAQKREEIEVQGEKFLVFSARNDLLEDVIYLDTEYRMRRRLSVQHTGEIETPDGVRKVPFSVVKFEFHYRKPKVCADTFAFNTSDQSRAGREVVKLEGR